MGEPDSRAAEGEDGGDGRRSPPGEGSARTGGGSRQENPASSIDTTLELTKKAAALLELCGGDRRQVERLLDIAELVTEDRI